MIPFKVFARLWVFLLFLGALTGCLAPLETGFDTGVDHEKVVQPEGSWCWDEQNPCVETSYCGVDSDDTRCLVVPLGTCLHVDMPKGSECFDGDRGACDGEGVCRDP